DWMVSINSLGWARNARPSSTVHGRSASICAIKVGNLATALTLSSHGCSSSLAMLFVSFTKRAAWTISNGYTEAGRMTAMSGSGGNEMGMTRFSRLLEPLGAGAEGGGTAAAGAGSGTAGFTAGVGPTYVGGGGSFACWAPRGICTPQLMPAATTSS